MSGCLEFQLMLELISASSSSRTASTLCGASSGTRIGHISPDFSASAAAVVMFAWTRVIQLDKVVRVCNFRDRRVDQSTKGKFNSDAFSVITDRLKCNSSWVIV